jgi:DNA-binding response OmpR family regulator
VAQGQRVLVVDGLSETEEVLRAVLEPRGLEVDRVRASWLRDLTAKRRPSVVIVHVDEASLPDPAPERWADVPRILIGSTRATSLSQNGNGNGHGDHYLEKPFHYGELIRAIERALAVKNG